MNAFNTSNNTPYKNFNEELRLLRSSGDLLSSKLARALSLRESIEVSSIPSNPPALPTGCSVSHSAIKESNSLKELTEDEHDDKSSMASVSIIASTSQQGVCSDADRRKSLGAPATLSPFTTDIQEYERRLSNHQGFTADVCKLFNGHSQHIGMFPLRIVKQHLYYF